MIELMDVMLIQPPTPCPNRPHSSDSTLSTPPISLGYIASMLIKAGFSVDIVDMEISGMRGKDILKTIEEYAPRMVGISTTTLTFKNALRVAAIAKTINPEISTVLGGPHVTFMADEALSHPQVDYVVRGEGELTLTELAGHVLNGSGDRSNIRGLSMHNHTGGVIHNIERSLIRDLDMLPFPARHLLPLHLYSAPGLIITGRGCDGRCIFCAARGISGNRYRLRSVKNVISEIEKISTLLGLKLLFFGDDTFTAMPERTRELCRELINKGLQMNWMCETRADRIDRETLKLMADAGCAVAQFGAESGSQSILNSVRKGITIKALLEAVKTAQDVGIHPTCSFMFPHPEDTWETVKETMSLIKKLKAIGAGTAISLTTPFPGTYLSAHLSDLGLRLICDDTDQYNFSIPVIETKNFDVWDIREIYTDLVMLCLS